MSADVNEELRNLSRKLKLYEKLMKEIEEINQRDVLTIFEEKFLVHRENHEEKVIPIEVILFFIIYICLGDWSDNKERETAGA